ncbi:MAG: hypothetical protein ABIO55_12510 [Ginsengibacter sp.]
MVPIKEAINSGAWLTCEYNENRDEICRFRLKVLSFKKLNLLEVDNPERIELIDGNANMWLMEIEVINLMKEPIMSYNGPGSYLILIDQDGYKFHIFSDAHLRHSSGFAKKSGMYRFYQQTLIPKTKAIGAIPFQLPEDDEAVYSISMKEGNIREA